MKRQNERLEITRERTAILEVSCAILFQSGGDSREILKPATIFFAIHWSKVRERQSIMKPKPCWSKSFESKTYICDVFCQPRELSERSEVKIVTKQLFSSQQYLESIGEIATITINTRSVNICEWVNRADHSH